MKDLWIRLRGSVRKSIRELSINAFIIATANRPQAFSEKEIVWEWYCKFKVNLIYLKLALPESSSYVTSDRV